MSAETTIDPKPRVVMERLVRLEDADRSFDIEFWQRQDDAAIFAAAWAMVVLAHKLKGRDLNELRFQKTLKKLSNEDPDKSSEELG